MKRERDGSTFLLVEGRTGLGEVKVWIIAARNYKAEATLVLDEH